MSIATTRCRARNRVTLVGDQRADRPRILRLGVVDYRDGVGRAAPRCTRRWSPARAPDTVLLLEHPSVYTAGKRTEPCDRPIDGTPVVDVDRGGKITWHGPGQLVGYPIMQAARPGRRGRLRAAHRAAADRRLRRVRAGHRRRIEGRSGVWVPADDRGPDRKVAAIGIRVARGVTLHGFALNCDCDLARFDRIVPCGIRDAGVTSLTAELGRPVTVADDPGRRAPPPHPARLTPRHRRTGARAALRGEAVQVARERGDLADVRRPESAGPRTAPARSRTRRAAASRAGTPPDRTAYGSSGSPRAASAAT